MASKDKKEARKNSKRTGKYAASYGARRGFLFGSLKTLRKIIGTIIAIILIFLLLSGAINQVKTGQTIANYFVSIGKSIGNFFAGIPDGNSPFKVNGDGIYFKNADVPDHSAIDPDKLPDVPTGDDINNAVNGVAEKGGELLNKDNSSDSTDSSNENSDGKNESNSEGD